MSDSQQKKKGKNIIVILLVCTGLLTGAAGFLAKVAFIDKDGEIETLQRRSTSAEDRFKRLTSDVEKAKSLLSTIDITGIDSIALGQDVEAIRVKRKESAEKIATLEGQIADLIEQSDGQASNFSQFKALYAKLKTEVYLLRSEISKLKAKNQALISENAKLKEENQQLGSDLAGANENNQKLEGINNDLEGKVALGKRLQTFEKIAEGVKVRRNGEEKSTNRARRADKIRVAFTIGKNEIADAGEIDLFLRVLDPDDRVISENGEEFNYKSEKITYTSKKSVNYQKSSKDVIMFAEKTGGQSFQEGLYKVQVYTKSDMILVETFSLK
jgi:regulator of replication initiation timing